MNAVLSGHKAYGAQFSEVADRLPGRGSAWVDRLRRKALDRFLELGFPTTRLEDWKYTNVAPIGRLTFRLPSPPAIAPESLGRQIDLFPEPRLVFVDGALDQSFSAVEAGDSSLQLAGLSGALADAKQAAMLERHLGQYADISNHALGA
jgi:Fe-S cluster assembly protein SufD